jgi:hypothetical protein
LQRRLNHELDLVARPGDAHWDAEEFELACDFEPFVAVENDVAAVDDERLLDAACPHVRKQGLLLARAETRDHGRLGMGFQRCEGQLDDRGAIRACSALVCTGSGQGVPPKCGVSERPYPSGTSGLCRNGGGAND